MKTEIPNHSGCGTAARLSGSDGGIPGETGSPPRAFIFASLLKSFEDRLQAPAITGPKEFGMRERIKGAIRKLKLSRKELETEIESLVTVLSGIEKWPARRQVVNVLFILLALVAISLTGAACLANAAGFARDGYTASDSWVRPVIFSAPFLLAPFIIKYAATETFSRYRKIFEVLLIVVGFYGVALYVTEFSSHFAVEKPLGGFFLGGEGDDDDPFGDSSAQGVSYENLLLGQIIAETVLAYCFCMWFTRFLAPQKSSRWMAVYNDLESFRRRREKVDDELIELEGQLVQMDAEVASSHAFDQSLDQFSRSPSE